MASRLQAVDLAARMRTARSQTGKSSDLAVCRSMMHFQRIKGMPESGLMTTETLNALGVKAVP